MNLPNKLTIARICMIPLFVFFLLTDLVPYSNYVSVAIFIVACLTDALDGHIARKYNLISNFGKFMDPLADKLLVCSALVCFVQMHLVPAWIIIVIISREFIISGFRLIASDNGLVLAASWWGKFKTASQMIMSILLIVNFDGDFFNTLEQVFIYLALALTVISLIDYLIKNKNVLKEGSK
ncbi:CDP-diacylglycerol--glycerol-3-phosphate 3-phosphatidyltransferase [Anaerosporobacter faecicola]|uniref:CDP-diacylglycerol--glycerol-3-phosphate 3-phosphatidyltransferase n=1 Tax=Anaerosporobacter faecicola TaxID=2718714 RepID=UPI00143CADB2|nr:CDP-diacylglycerol--glycerol-3-phosphate 3-phosphatidyltransferase [Anaerosporobacter faecicola]